MRGSIVHKGLKLRYVGVTACSPKRPIEMKPGDRRTNRWFNVTCTACLKTAGFDDRDHMLRFAAGALEIIAKRPG